MTKPIDAAKDAIRALHEHITALGVAAQEAAVLLRNAIAGAIEEITGGTKPRAGRPARAARKVAPAVAARTKPAAKPAKGGKRGAKPGGRQLKAFLGVKAYDALSDEVRVKGRAVISALKDEWKAMSRKEQADALAKAGIHGSSGAGATAKARKPRKGSKSKSVAAAMPKDDPTAS